MTGGSARPLVQRKSGDSLKQIVEYATAICSGRASLPTSGAGQTMRRSVSRLWRTRTLNSAELAQSAWAAGVLFTRKELDIASEFPKEFGRLDSARHFARVATAFSRQQALNSASLNELLQSAVNRTRWRNMLWSIRDLVDFLTAISAGSQTELEKSFSEGSFRQALLFMLNECERILGLPDNDLNSNRTSGNLDPDGSGTDIGSFASHLDFLGAAGSEMTSWSGSYSCLTDDGRRQLADVAQKVRKEERRREFSMGGFFTDAKHHGLSESRDQESAVVRPDRNRIMLDMGSLLVSQPYKLANISQSLLKWRIQHRALISRICERLQSVIEHQLQQQAACESGLSHTAGLRAGNVSTMGLNSVSGSEVAFAGSMFAHGRLLSVAAQIVRDTAELRCPNLPLVQISLRLMTQALMAHRRNRHNRHSGAVDVVNHAPTGVQGKASNSGNIYNKADSEAARLLFSTISLLRGAAMHVYLSRTATAGAKSEAACPSTGFENGSAADGDNAIFKGSKAPFSEDFVLQTLVELSASHVIKDDKEWGKLQQCAIFFDFYRLRDVCEKGLWRVGAASGRGAFAGAESDATTTAPDISRERAMCELPQPCADDLANAEESSMLHMQVSGLLRSMKVSHRNEVSLREPNKRADIVIELDGGEARRKAQYCAEDIVRKIADRGGHSDTDTIAQKENIADVFGSSEQAKKHDQQLDPNFLLQQKYVNRKRANAQTLILEVDGPAHFIRKYTRDTHQRQEFESDDYMYLTTNENLVSTGLSDFSTHLLEKCGYKVVRIPFFHASEKNIRKLAQTLQPS